MLAWAGEGSILTHAARPCSALTKAAFLRTPQRTLRRRATLLASVATLLSPSARGQQPAKVGWLSLTASGMNAEITARGYVKGLREAGFEEGRSLTLVRRSAEGDVFKLRALARADEVIK